MSTISDAVSKKRNEGDGPRATGAQAADSHTPRVVRVEVPKDHAARNMLLGALLVALLLTALLVGGYAILDRMGAFKPQPAAAPPPGAGHQAGPTSVDTTRVENTGVQPGNAAGESGQPALPKLQGILGDRVAPIALINGRRIRPGGVVDGYTLKAVGDDRVTLERDGKQYELILE